MEKTLSPASSRLRGAPANPPRNALWKAGAAPVPLAANRFFDILALCRRGNLVLRGGGLSLFHSCQFEGFQRRHDGSRHDSGSGLWIRPSSMEAVWLIMPPDAPPRFEVLMRDSGASLSFFPETVPALVPLCDQIQAGAALVSRGKALTPPPVPAAWLDHNLSENDNAWRNKVFLRENQRGYHADVILRSAGLSFRCRFPVSSTDMFGNVFRFAAPGAEDVLHLLAPGFTRKHIPGGLSLTSKSDPSFSSEISSDKQSLTLSPQ